MNIAAKIDAAIKAVCPIHGVSVGRKDAKETWRIDFADDATAEQRAAAVAALEAFDAVMVQQPTLQERIAAIEARQTPRLLREAVLGGEYAKGVLADIDAQIDVLRAQLR